MRHLSAVLITLLLNITIIGCSTAYVSKAPVQVDSKPIVSKDDLDGAILISDIDPESIKNIKSRIDSLISRGAHHLTFKINSDGGDVEPGFMLIQYIEEKIKTGITTKCFVDFRARSMAFIFLQSKACQERFATKRSLFMAHEPLLPRVTGNRNVLRQAIMYLDALSDAMATVAGSRIHMGIEAYKQKIKDGDWFFPYLEALNEGAIDGCVEEENIPYVYEPTAPLTP